MFFVVGTRRVLSILLQAGQHGILTHLQRMAAHTIIFLDDPPPILNRFALIVRLVEERRRNIRAFCADAAQEKRRQRGSPFRRQIRLRHPQAILRFFLFALIVNPGRLDLVLEESLVCIPLFAMLVRLWINALLGFLCLKREVQTLNRRAAFGSQLLTDALLILEAR